MTICVVGQELTTKNIFWKPPTLLKQLLLFLIITIIIVFQKCHKIIFSEMLAMVGLVGKENVKQKSFEPTFENCERGAFNNCIR